MAKRRKKANFPTGSIYPSIRAQQQKELRKHGGTGFKSERKIYPSWQYSSTICHKQTLYPSEYSTLRQRAPSDSALKFSPVRSERSFVKIIRYKQTGEERLVMLNERQNWKTCTKFIAVDGDGHFRTFLPDQLPSEHRIVDISIECLPPKLQRFASAGAALVEQTKSTLANQVLAPL